MIVGPSRDHGACCLDPNSDELIDLTAGQSHALALLAFFGLASTALYAIKDETLSKPLEFLQCRSEVQG
jgi:hypothetical protein